MSVVARCDPLRLRLVVSDPTNGSVKILKRYIQYTKVAITTSPQLGRGRDNVLTP